MLFIFFNIVFCLNKCCHFICFKENIKNCGDGDINKLIIFGFPIFLKLKIAIIYICQGHQTKNSRDLSVQLYLSFKKAPIPIAVYYFFTPKICIKGY